MGEPEEGCLWLGKAIALDGECRVMARGDEDFGDIRGEACFLELVREGA